MEREKKRERKDVFMFISVNVGLNRAQYKSLMFHSYSKY